ncbi:Variant surface glycoprotein [Trypanosoma congolense IL3000]|uniref:Variant surface glycoprotein n=1 Tax=Trypanosoma congolense (strain IL3000) TaxID=1068625 RepID=F9WGJ1_TRYCI|nr:Variant surface glycoprotein [Trypanosoma congolense IL3000]
MAFFVNMIAFPVFLCSFWVDASGKQNTAEVKSMDNSEQFALLCRIYNVAENPPIHHVDLPDPLKIVTEIDAINASFTEEKQPNETEQAENSTDAQVKPTITRKVITREVAVSQAILRRISHKAHTIVDEIRNLKATRDIEKVKANFDQVIFGEGMNESELCKGTLKGVNGRATACGKPGDGTKGNSAGKNLVVDFFCLCAMRTSVNGKDNEGISNVCGVEVGGKSKDVKHSWGDACPPTSSTMWASVKKGCGKLTHTNPKFAAEGHEILNDFLKHLEMGGVYRSGDSSGSNRKKGMLGTSVGTEEQKGVDLICDGSKGYTKSGGKPPGGVCVFYGHESEWDNIDWLLKFKTALASVDTLNNKTATIQQAIQKLETLLHRAEKIYETAKVISEIQNPVVPHNLPTAAKRLTAYSAARNNPHAHFILLFVLL